jgi:hypothetical protein
MQEFDNCNFKEGDIIIGVNPDNRSSFLTIAKIKKFNTHEDMNRTIVDSAMLQFASKDDIDGTSRIGIHAIVDINILNKDFNVIATSSYSD